MTVKAQEFGEAKANINNLMNTMAVHIANTEKAIERIDERIDDHMNKEEMERKAMEKMIRDNEDASQLRHAARAEVTDARFAKIELFMNKVEWGMKALSVGLMVVAPLAWNLISFLWKVAMVYLTKGTDFADLVTQTDLLFKI